MQGLRLEDSGLYPKNKKAHREKGERGMEPTRASSCLLKDNVGCSVKQGHEWKCKIPQVATVVAQKRDDGWMRVVALEKKLHIFQLYFGGKFNVTRGLMDSQ